MPFAEVARRLPAGWDDHRFFAIGPRHLEAALTGTAQILVEGEYDGVLEPGRHYLPVRADLSDLGDVLAQTAEPEALQPVATRAYDDICLSGRYSYRRLADTIDAALHEHGAVGRRRRTPAFRIGRRLAAAEAEAERRTALLVGAVARCVLPAARLSRQSGVYPSTAVCGIAGAVFLCDALTRARPGAQPALRAMNDLQQHRGPDGQAPGPTRAGTSASPTAG